MENKFNQKKSSNSMGNTFKKSSLFSRRQMGELDRKFCIAEIASPVFIYTNGLNKARLMEEIDYETLVKAKLHTKKAVIPFSFPRTVMDSVIRSENPIFIRGRLCELFAENVNKEDPITGTMDSFRVLILKELPLLPGKANLSPHQINKKMMYRRQHPISCRIMSANASQRTILGGEKVVITNKGNDDYILLYQYANPSDQIRGSADSDRLKNVSLIDPIRRKTLVKIPMEGFQVPDEFYNAPPTYRRNLSKYNPVMKFEMVRGSEGQKAFYLTQFYSNSGPILPL